MDKDIYIYFVLMISLKYISEERSAAVLDLSESSLVLDWFIHRQEEEVDMYWIDVDMY